MRGMYERIDRRGFVTSVASAWLAGAAGANAPAPRPQARRRVNSVIRNAYVLTLDPAGGDIAAGDVHFRNGAIVAVGRNVEAPGADVIDGSNTIVLPGFVETHWHMWNGLLRGLVLDGATWGYFPLQRLADGHRLVTTAYDDLGQGVLPVGAGVRVDRGAAEERGPQHPAVAVDADDPRRLGGVEGEREACVRTRGDPEPPRAGERGDRRRGAQNRRNVRSRSRVAGARTGRVTVRAGSTRRHGLGR